MSIKKISFLANKIQYKEKQLIRISLIISALYLVVRFIDDFFLFSGGVGDEWYFTNDLNYFIENGYHSSVLRGISIPYTLISYAFYQLTNEISISLRLTGSLFTLVLILYFFLRQSNIIHNRRIYFIYLLFLISTTGGSFYGTNDSIFSTSLLIFLHELLFVDAKNKYNHLLLIISSTLAIISRPIVILYLVVLFLSLMFLKIFQKDYNLKRIFSKISLVFLSTIIIVLLFNYPKISSGKYTLSFSTKTTSSEHYIAKDINWVQWFYFSQLVHNQNGSGYFAPMVEWKDVRSYKQLNGDATLPKSFTDYLINYKVFIMKRLPKSLVEVSMISIRYVGILLLLLPLVAYNDFRKKLPLDNLLLIFIIIFGIVSWVILMPNLVQHRHLFPYYVLLLFIYTSKTPKPGLPININSINIIVIDIIIAWSLWKEGLFYRI